MTRPAAPVFILAVWSLWRREVLRFIRQCSRVVGALGTPVIFWFIIGSGVGGSFRPPGTAEAGTYLQYGFPGTVALIVLFTAIFAMISVIEDRQAGFLQGVLVAPVGRSAIVFGKVLGSTTLAVGQVLLFVLAGPLAGVPLSVISMFYAFVVLVVMAVALSGLGFWIAWSMDSTQGFHAIMNLFLIPMWLLSGAFFPAEGASAWLRWIMCVNPLTYGVSALRSAIFYGTSRGSPASTGLVSLGIMLAFAGLMLGMSMHAAARRN